MHDLAVVRHPERFRSWQRASGRRRLSKVRRADQVICISRFTAEEAMALLNLPSLQIRLWFTTGVIFIRASQCRPNPNLISLSRTNISCSSVPWSLGKTSLCLEQVYALAESRKLLLPPLLIVGARWEGVDHEGAPPKGWHYLGRLPDEVLVYLYRHAIGFVFPSKYEGFGFPVVEAMSLGCPVICSPVASLPEVGGAAALFADMTPDAYLKAMRQVSSETGLRNELIERGLAQAAKFSWNKCASEVLEVYRATLRSG